MKLRPLLLLAFCVSCSISGTALAQVPPDAATEGAAAKEAADRRIP